MLFKPKAILFDLGDTLIEYLSFDPIRGNEALLKYANNKNGVDLEQIQS